MSTVTFQQFIDILPKAPKLPIALAPSELARHGIEDPEPFPQFVPPHLSLVAEGADSPSILLISAPGAVGKTTLARELARRCGSPLWQLGQVNVGHEFLVGAIARVFGDTEYSRVKNELVNGQRALVLDGLDEARLRAGENNFEAFLERLADDFQETGSHPALVLLGRTDSVSETADWLGLYEVPSARYEIEYFTEESSVSFIGAYLDQNSDEKSHRTAPDQFAQARDAILHRLSLAVPEGVNPKSLAGYAPVLELVSELLDVGNPWSEFQAIERESEKWRLETLVGEIARGLLDREHEKTVEKLESEFSRQAGTDFEWSNAYQRDEQCLRLLANAAEYSLKDLPPKTLPRDLREPYERHLEKWVEDHPFTAQPLFLEYAYAWLFTSGSFEPQLASAVREYLVATTSARGAYRPTPLLARFVADFSAGEEGRPQFQMYANDFGFVYESAVAGIPSGEQHRLSLMSSTSDGEIIGEFTSGDIVAGVARRVPVHLLDVGGGLWLWRRLSSSDIQVEGQVQIGTTDTDFVLGPDVGIEAGTFVCESRKLRVVAPTPDLAVFLAAETYQGGVVQLVGTPAERSHLGISWTPLQHPWAQYVVDVEPAVTVTEEMRDAFRQLRRVLVWFRAAGFQELARHEDLMENPAVAGSERGRAILDFCVDQRLVRFKRPMYVLDRNALDSLGINWSDLQQGRITQPIARFLEEYLGNSD